MGIFDFLFGSKKKEQAKEQLRRMLVMAMADGEVSKMEMAIIGQICQQKYELTEADFENALKTIGDVKFERPKNIEEAVSLTTDLFMVMLADGRLHENELEHFFLAGAAFGVPEDTLRDIVLTASNSMIAPELDVEEFLSDYESAS